MRIIKILFISVASLLLLFGLVGCGSKQPSSSPQKQQPSTSQNSVPKNNGQTQKSQTNNSQLTLENIVYSKTGMLLTLTHGDMKQAYTNPQITSGNPKKFEVTLKNVSQGKYPLSQQISVNKEWAQSLDITKHGSDLVLAFTIKPGYQNSIQPIKAGIGGGFEISFDFISSQKQAQSNMAMPSFPHGKSLSDNSTIKTSYGIVSFSSKKMKITNNDLTVFLNSGGTQQKLYTLHQKGYKELVGGQVEGQYLLLKFGFPPSAQPTTGDFGYQDIVIDLKSQKVVLNNPLNVQSMSYLTKSYYAESSFSFDKQNTGITYSFVYVANLSTKKGILVKLPSNVNGYGVLSGDTLYYKLNKKVHTVKLPNKGWQPLNEKNIKPIQVSS